MALWPRALGRPATDEEPAVPPNLGAVHAVIRVLERRARYLGLDAPVKIAGALEGEAKLGEQGEVVFTLKLGAPPPAGMNGGPPPQALEDGVAL